MRARKIRRACWGIAATSVLAGGVLRVIPAGGEVAAAPAVPLEVPAPLPVPAANPLVAEDIVMANVFAASRTPPPARYTPPELAGDSAGGLVADAPTDPAMLEEYATEGEVPRLFGTVVGPEGTRALLHLDAATSGPRLYAAGEADGGYRVLSITPRQVVLRGPRGRITLRLDPEEDRP